jgi:hypothetical protein
VKTILRSAGFRAEGELTKFVDDTVDFATWNERESGGAALVELSKPGDSGVTRCVMKVFSEDVGELTVGGIGTDAWEAVRRTGDLLESAFVTRWNRLTQLRGEAPSLAPERLGKAASHDTPAPPPAP